MWITHKHRNNPNGKQKSKFFGNFRFLTGSSAKLWIKSLRKISVILLIFSWVFAGWPQISGFPPRIQVAWAAITFERMPSETSTSSPVPLRVLVNYPDDLVYDGLSGSVGLTREQLLNMKWWGIAAYTETENFVSECVPTTSPLPPAIFNLRTGNYKTEISLAKTKEGCEAYSGENFSGNVYPLFAAFETANFTVK